MDTYKEPTNYTSLEDVNATTKNQYLNNTNDSIYVSKIINGTETHLVKHPGNTVFEIDREHTNFGGGSSKRRSNRRRATKRKKRLIKKRRHSTRRR